MIKKIKKHLAEYNFDIRVTNDARFMDQKVTPDVLCIIADCIINYVQSKNNDSIFFSTKDIWNFDYSNQNVKKIFNKPDVLDKSAKSEYDKFFQQPLKALAYSKVLTCKKKGNQNLFQINNLEILMFISIKERNALNFLLMYLEKVLRDSGVWEHFDIFWKKNNKEQFDLLKHKYENFILKYTPIKGRTEIRRIFTKIINPIAYNLRLRGTEKGYISKNIIDYSDLMYNRRNWRDIVKLKSETRDQHELRAKKVIDESSQAYIQYSIQKAKKIVKDLHYPISEVKDEFANDNAIQIHHIFTASEYPQISSYLENLILLTANQHLTHAHPNNNTRLINRDYQLVCLTSKSETIEKKINEGKIIYSKEDFLFVVETGLKVKINNSLNFDGIREKLIRIYNET